MMKFVNEGCPNKRDKGGERQCGRMRGRLVRWYEKGSGSVKSR
jgi:hypothetical protein